ncbi:MAG TPA: hypothetical protein VFD88_04885 [Clostridia bacterium]|nr:hypothetical protein [Clostridia bacterium]
MDYSPSDVCWMCTSKTLVGHLNVTNTSGAVAVARNPDPHSVQFAKHAEVAFRVRARQHPAPA